MALSSPFQTRCIIWLDWGNGMKIYPRMFCLPDLHSRYGFMTITQWSNCPWQLFSVFPSPMYLDGDNNSVKGGATLWCEGNTAKDCLDAYATRINGRRESKIAYLVFNSKPTPKLITAALWEYKRMDPFYEPKGLRRIILVNWENSKGIVVYE